MSAIEWRYLPQGVVRHALAKADSAVAACGLWCVPASYWRGTGSQSEYERAAELPDCLNCVKVLGR